MSESEDSRSRFLAAAASEFCRVSPSDVAVLEPIHCSGGPLLGGLKNLASGAGDSDLVSVRCFLLPRITGADPALSCLSSSSSESLPRLSLSSFFGFLSFFSPLSAGADEESELEVAGATSPSSDTGAGAPLATAGPLVMGAFEAAGEVEAGTEDFEPSSATAGAAGGAVMGAFEAAG